MSGAEWATIGIAMGIACAVVCRWWVRVTDVREPHYAAVWSNVK